METKLSRELRRVRPHRNWLVYAATYLGTLPLFGRDTSEVRAQETEALRTRLAITPTPTPNP